MAASSESSCHEMEGDLNQTPTNTTKEDLMDVMALDQDGTQPFPPETLPSSILEGFQATSTQHTLLDMDLTGSLDLRPPISSSQPSMELTRFMDTLTLQQLSEMTRTQYKSLKDTLSTEVGELKNAVDTLTLHVDSASVKQATELKQLISNQFEYFRKEFNNMLHWQLKKHHAEVLKDFNTVMEPMAKTLDFIQKSTDQNTQQINTFLAPTGSNSNLQNELHQCTQHLYQLVKDIEALKSSPQSSVKANVAVPTNTSLSASTDAGILVVSTRLQ